MCIYTFTSTQTHILRQMMLKDPMILTHQALKNVETQRQTMPSFQSEASYLSTMTEFLIKGFWRMFPFFISHSLPSCFISMIGPAMLFEVSCVTTLSPANEGLYHACALAGQVQVGQAARPAGKEGRASQCYKTCRLGIKLSTGISSKGLLAMRRQLHEWCNNLWTGGKRLLLQKAWSLSR